MILWMTRDAFTAAVFGVLIVIVFVGYNSARHVRKNEAAAKKVASKTDAERERPSRWN
jgi:hypothetical protein